jgi:hypothetical protein
MPNTSYSYSSPPFPEIIQSSLQTLGFADGVAPSSVKELNKRYHLLALKHHPDKATAAAAADSSIEASAAAAATERFKEINDAHKRVKEYFYSADGVEFHMETGYDSILQLFIQTIIVKMTATATAATGSAPDASAIQSLIHLIITNGIQSGITMFRNMEKHSCMTIYEILSRNQDLFGISQDIMDELTRIVEEKTGDDLVVRLNPSLLDMLLDRVYILQENGHSYYIPLWHSELHFKNAAAAAAAAWTSDDALEREHEVIVLCDPELPENVSIDDNNNLFISLAVDIRDLFVRQVVPIYINDEVKAHGFVYYLHACDITLRADAIQCVLLRGVAGAECGGIAMCNTKTSDIYNVGTRANVYANIRLTIEN